MSANASGLEKQASLAMHWYTYKGHLANCCGQSSPVDEFTAGSRPERRSPPIRPRFAAMRSQLSFRFVFIAAIEVGWHNTAIVLGSQGHVVITDRPNHIHFD